MLKRRSGSCRPTTLVGTALACLAVSLGLEVEGGLGTKAKVVIKSYYLPLGSNREKLSILF